MKGDFEMSLTPSGFNQLMEDEGYRQFVYDDKNGMTIQRGSAGGAPTVGYGRNLATRGLTKLEAIYLLQNDIAEVWASVSKQFPWVQQIDPIWQDVVTMVDFNTGDVAGFPKFLAALNTGDAETARAELLDSKAAHELPARYGRMADALRNKHW
jgi:lysozyme